jgi:hypothetical protein
MCVLYKKPKATKLRRLTHATIGVKKLLTVNFAIAKSTKGTQLTWMDTWVKRLIIFRFSFLYSTHMDVGYRYALRKVKISNFKLSQNGREV